MKVRKAFMSIALSLLLSSAAGTAFCASTDGPPPPFHGMGQSGICADQSTLYVMAGGKILLYNINDLRLIKEVDLPSPAPPSAAGPQTTAAPKRMAFDGFPPPHPPMGPQGLCISNGYLYVLAGPMIYRYTTPDLALQDSIELPKPEFPQLELPKTRN